MASVDEDAPRTTRGKTRRPRDELGRPLPWDAENRLEIEDFDARSLEENHRLGIEHFNAGRFFQAHEAWETCWKQAKGTEDEEFFKGLSQLGAGYVHYRRGNPHGAQTLIARGVSRIRPHGPSHHGVRVDRLVEAAEADAERFREAERDGSPIPEVTPPTI
jgi:hypothetical protein